jgi:hypothetical protein
MLMPSIALVEPGAPVKEKLNERHSDTEKQKPQDRPVHRFTLARQQVHAFRNVSTGLQPRGKKFPDTLRPAVSISQCFYMLLATI